MNGIIRYLVITASISILTLETYSQTILDPELAPPDIRWDNFLIKGGEAG